MKFGVALLCSKQYNAYWSRVLNVGCVLADLDPTNYMTFYRRATVYLAMGKSKSALPDLDLVLSLKPDFNAVSCPCHSVDVLSFGH